MARIDLVVPFSEKDKAKSLGARWDPSQKTWYVPDGMSVAALVRWLPKPGKSELEHKPEFAVRSPFYYVVESTSDCWNCSNRTRVFAFMLPEEHEEFEYVYDEDEEFELEHNLGEWRCHEYRGNVASVHSMSPAVSKQMRRFTSNFKLAYSKAAGSRYFMNHCEQCGTKLGDHFMHGEPGGAFVPMSPEQASRMSLVRINERFDANCGLGFSSEDFFDWMQVRDQP